MAETEVIELRSTLKATPKNVERIAKAQEAMQQDSGLNGELATGFILWRGSIVRGQATRTDERTSHNGSFFHMLRRCVQSRVTHSVLAYWSLRGHHL